MAQISPIFNIPFFTDEDGNPLAGGKIFTYEAGSSSVLKITYTGPTESVANSNPIVLNSAGQLPAGVSIWLLDGEAYNLILTASDGTTVLKQFDNVTGVIPPPAAGTEADNPIWIDTAAPTYLSGTQFLVPGNFVSQFGIGNRARLTLSTGYVYATVTAVSFSSPNTTVTVALDGGAVLNGTISKAEASLLIAAGKTVDAGAVSYTNPFNYSVPNTVGYKLNETINNLDTVNNVLSSTISRNANVWVANGAGANTPYSISPSPALSSYSNNGAFLIRFLNQSFGNPSLNISGLGAVPLLQFNGNTNTLEPAAVTGGLLSQVVYDGGNFILLDRTYAVTGPVLVLAGPFVSNTIITIPAGCRTLKVTLVGGGGGGVAAVDYESPTYSGGNGATAVATVPVFPGESYNLSIGAGGAGGTPGSGYMGQPGGTSTFGSGLVVAGGGGGGTWTNKGATGSTGGSVTVIPFNTPLLSNYGIGGVGGIGLGSPGVSGACILEYVVPLNV